MKNLRSNRFVTVTYVLIFISILWLTFSSNNVDQSTLRPQLTPQTCRSDFYRAVNVINSSRFYVHDPVFCNFPEHLVPVPKDHLVEFSGLKIPVRFDCDNFNNDQPWTPAMPYFSTVLDRNYRCLRLKLLHANHREYFVPELPLVDDEYHEYVQLIQVLLNAKKGKFVLVEAGSRWGTWGFRAMAIAKTLHLDLDVHVLFYEPDKKSCEAIRETAELNNFTNYQASCTYFSTEHFKGFASTVERIHYFDLDIQGVEESLVNEKDFIDVVEEKVEMIKVGTHSWDRVHDKVLDAFREWDIKENTTMNRIRFEVQWTYRFFKNWEKIRQNKFYNESPQGPVSNYDGVVLARNPALS